jgi:hypothetical protein
LGDALCRHATVRFVAVSVAIQKEFRPRAKARSVSPPKDRDAEAAQFDSSPSADAHEQLASAPAVQNVQNVQKGALLKKPDQDMGKSHPLFDL